MSEQERTHGPKAPCTEEDARQPAAQEAPQAEARTAPEPPEREAQTEQPEQKQPEAPADSGAAQAALKTKLEQAEKKLADAKDALLRTAAEYDNFRKRSAREHDAAFDNGVSFAVSTLLPVLDTLELAAQAETADEGYKKGVLMTLDKCREAFGKMGVAEIEAQGLAFDPELHAAVLQQPASEAQPSGTVTQVLQKGYKLHDKVVRHASVAVAE